MRYIMFGLAVVGIILVAVAVGGFAKGLTGTSVQPAATAERVGETVGAKLRSVVS